jgi:predicted DNA-binding transcriptional regulator YafY
MNQDIIDVDCNPSKASLQPFTEESLKTTEGLLKSAEVFTAKQLAEEFSVTERSIYSYIATIIKAYHWLPETEFKLSGNYTQKTVEQIRRLKTCKNANAYIALIASENQKPVIPTAKTSSALALPTRQTEVLESRLATIQGNLSAQNISVQDRVKLALTRISEEKQRTNNNQSALDEVRKQQIAMKATQDALEEHEVYQQVKNAVKEQLLIEELQQQG